MIGRKKGRPSWRPPRQPSLASHGRRPHFGYRRGRDNTEMTMWNYSGLSVLTSLMIPVELEVQATVIVRVHCSWHDDACCRQARREHPSTRSYLRAGQASAKEWAKRRSNEALAQRPPVTARTALTTLDWQKVRGRVVRKRESDSSNMCVKALSRASVL